MACSGKTILSASSRRDLKEIWKYIAADNETAADSLLDRFAEVLDLLGQSPLLGRSRNELRPGIRSFPVGNYIVFYRLGRSGITVVRRLSGYRNLNLLFPK